MGNDLQVSGFCIRIPLARGSLGVSSWSSKNRLWGWHGAFSAILVHSLSGGSFATAGGSPARPQLKGRGAALCSPCPPTYRPCTGLSSQTSRWSCPKGTAWKQGGPDHVPPSLSVRRSCLTVGGPALQVSSPCYVLTTTCLSLRVEQGRAGAHTQACDPRVSY